MCNWLSPSIFYNGNLKVPFHYSNPQLSLTAHQSVCPCVINAAPLTPCASLFTFFVITLFWFLEI